MPLISNELLRNRVRTTIPMQTPYRATENQKRENIASFHALSREGLENGTTERQLPIRKHREERENGIASAVPFSHFSIDAVTFDISKTPIPL